MKRTLVCLLVLFSFPIAQNLFAQSGPSPLIADPPSRTSISLDGMWNTIIDPYESGIWSHFYENRKPASKTDLIEYDFDRSPKLKVPGDWNSQREDLLWYEGPMWYQRSFSYQKKGNKRAFLYFGAVNYQSRVWLNGTKLGEHVGGYTPFNFEVTDQIKDGENSLVVEVDNTRRLEGVPSIHTDWWNYGGITRGAKLIEVPERFIENYSLHFEKHGQSDVIKGWVQINGVHGSTQASSVQAAPRITVSISGYGTIDKAFVSPDGRANVEFKADTATKATGVGCGKPGEQCKPLELWTPEKPKLYHVVISGYGDTVEDDIGFRTIETRGSQILLNGKPIFLRGISAHEEAPYRGGRSVSIDDDRTMITWAKELGCNFMRLTHYPHNEDMIRLADQMGMLIWDEVPVYWEIQFQNPAVLDNAKAQLRDVIARDQNRAAVIIWSLSNETPITAERTEFLHKMADYARSLDATRLISSASDKATHIDAQHMALNDPLGEYLDVIGLNEYVGWYFGKKEDADQIQWSFKYQKPVIITEFGGGAQYGLHGDSDTHFTEEYQADLYRHQLTMLNKIPALAGMSPWVLMDFRSPRRTLAGIQDYFNRKGLFSDRGLRKQAFYVLQKFYEEKAKQ